MNDFVPVPFSPEKTLLAEQLSVRIKKKTPRIAVVGDFCLDKYLYIYPELEEISVETGAAAFQVRAKRLFPGVGGTITGNLRSLGADASCFGVVGDDGEGFELLNALKKIGADVAGIIVADKVITGTYVKLMTPDQPSVKGKIQQPTEGKWVEGDRIDLRNPIPIPEDQIKLLKQLILNRISEFDAVVVSDQFAKGSEAVFSDDFRKFLTDLAKNVPNVFFLCDSRFFVNDYRNALVKCNASELFDAYDASRGAEMRKETTLDSDLETKELEICRIGKWMVDRNKRPVLVTRGAFGSILIESRNDRTIATAIPAIPVAPPIDICGAGDATNAGFVFAKSLGFSLAESAFLAGVVSSVTIKQIGVTGTASIKQILDVLIQTK